MKRNKKFTWKPPALQAFKRGPLLVFIVAVPVVVILAVIFCGCIKSLDCFKVRHVIMRPQGVEDFSYLKGRNIFQISPLYEIRRIESRYPAYRRLRMIKVYPDKIYVDFNFREPLAVVKSKRDYLVDKDAVFFDYYQESKPLPLVCGLEKKLYNSRCGTASKVPELLYSLSLIDTFNSDKGFNSMVLKSIEWRDAGLSMFLELEPGVNDKPGKKGQSLIEIKMSQEWPAQEKMLILSEVFSRRRDSLGEIKYVDLRFGDPVIKLKGIK